jgi:hypothetical protein
VEAMGSALAYAIIVATTGALLARRGRGRLTAGTACYDYRLNENGLVPYGSAESDYSTDVLKNKALGFLGAAREPFFLYFSPFAAHPPYTPAPKYQNAYSSLQMPRTPNFNEQDVSDKPQWIRSKPLLTSAKNRIRTEIEGISTGLFCQWTMP